MAVMHLSSPRWAARCAAVVALITLWTAAGQIQHTQAPVAKAVVQTVGLPAIDRGLRDQDPPRDARTAASIAHAVPSGRLPYVRGSLIVKFSDDATRGAIGAATRQVAGEIADRSSYAVLQKRSILHGRQELREPPELAPAEGCVEFVPEDERQRPLDRAIAHALERGGKIVDRGQL